MFVGMGQFLIAVIFPLSVWIPLQLMLYPRKCTEVGWKEHFFTLRNRWYSLRHFRTSANLVAMFGHTPGVD